jgi:hypothetical protein
MSLLHGGYGTGLNEVHATTEFDAWPLIPEEVSREIMSGIVEGSAALSNFRRLPNMSSRIQRMPILGSLGNADFTSNTVNDNLAIGADRQVDDLRMLELKGIPYGAGAPGLVPQEGIPGLKKTHQMLWENVFVVAETLAIILVVSDDVLADSSYNLWNEMRPRIIEAFYKKVDEAIIWGQGRPQTWPTGIVPTAIARGNTVVEGTGADLGIDVSNLMGLLEQQGYDPTAFMTAPSVKASLRNLRDATGQPIFAQGNLQGRIPDAIYGLPTNYVKNGSFVDNIGRIICGKADEAVFSIREDFRMQIFTEGVITDENGRVIMNLMQNDMKAMRVVMRMGWALPNPIHQLRPDRDGYPFAILTR